MNFYYLCSQKDTQRLIKNNTDYEYKISSSPTQFP